MDIAIESMSDIENTLIKDSIDIPLIGIIFTLIVIFLTFPLYRYLSNKTVQTRPPTPAQV